MRVLNNKPYRVVQWTTGNVGKSSVRAIAANPTSSWSAATRGRRTRSAATSASCAASTPLGVAATNDVDALLALKPDCVVYNPMWIDVDELVRILDAGVNVVATAAFITGHNLGRRPRPDRRGVRARRLDDVRHRASAPGFAELLAIVAASICDRVDKVTVNEAADTTFYDSPATEMPVGLRPADRRPRPARR